MEIERAAEAVYPILAAAADFYGQGFEPWAEAVADPDGDSRVEDSRKIVRAVLQAIREPSEAMCEDGYAAACKHDYGDMVPSHEIAPATWRAMIDKLLEE